MAELKKGDRVNLTSGGYVSIDKELGRGGQGIVYLVDLKGEKKALNRYLNVPDDKFYKNLEHNIMGSAPLAAFLWPEYLTKKEEGSYGCVMKLRSQNYFEFGNFLLAKKLFVLILQCLPMHELPMKRQWHRQMQNMPRITILQL